MNDTHLIWFNGTGESPKDNSHLFENINKDDYTVVSGWGTPEFRAKNLSPKTEQSLGIGSRDLKIIRDKFHELNILEKIKNKDKVIVGGFSRGAAFFVPFFIDFMFQESNCDFSKFMVLLIDPVTGTKHNKNGWVQNIAAEVSKVINKIFPIIKGYSNTVKTLEDEGLFSPKDKRESIIDKLPKKCELYGIVLCPGFEHKHKFFPLDDTFLNAFELVGLQKLYTARMGITHGALCSWSTRNKKDRDTFINTFKVYSKTTRKRWKPWEIIPDDKTVLTFHQLDQELQSMLQANLDIEVTKTLFESLLSDNIPNEDFFHKLHSRINATNNLLTNYKYIDYEKNDRPRIIDGTTIMKKGMREIENKSAGDLKKLLENWREEVHPSRELEMESCNV
ncbi:MAG: hypothetical protein QNJ51_14190 [Calothrix sp. MO_167.B12]|nr:hypothetical protein [Calothrix sp. MO_167.B12]